jgi:hypothetical protein
MGLLKTECRIWLAGCAFSIAAAFLIAFVNRASAQAVQGLTATRVATGLS